MTRLLVLPALVAAIVVVRVLLARRSANTSPRRRHAVVPTRLTDGAERTWVVFTTPWCTTCDPVVDRLRAADPDGRVVKLDATVERALADSFAIRSAPTALLAGRDGVVTAQLVGVGAVDAYLSTTTT